MIEGPNGRPMIFHGLDQSLLDAAGNMNPVDVEYYNLRISGDLEGLKGFLEPFKDSLFLSDAIGNYESNYINAGRFVTELSPEQLYAQQRTIGLIIAVPAVFGTSYGAVIIGEAIVSACITNAAVCGTALYNAADFVTNFVEGGSGEAPRTPAGYGGFIAGRAYEFLKDLSDETD